MFPTFHQGNLPMLATARDTAGLRCPPDTPPDTSMPSSAPRPQLRGTRDSEPPVLIYWCADSYSYPQLMVKKSPFVRRDNTDWAMEAVPKQTSTKVPRLFFSQIYLDK